MKRNGNSVTLELLKKNLKIKIGKNRLKKKINKEKEQN